MVFYTIASNEDKSLLNQALVQWHAELNKVGIRIEMIMASRADDKPAVMHSGYPALATIKIVGVKDRLTKKYDAELTIDERSYGSLKTEGKLALLDHELSHLQLKRTKPTKDRPFPLVKMDDYGRPMLKSRKGDWNAGDGFGEVCARHGEQAIEFENLRLAYGRARAAAKDGEV